MKQNHTVPNYKFSYCGTAQPALPPLPRASVTLLRPVSIFTILLRNTPSPDALTNEQLIYELQCSDLPHFTKAR